MIYLEDSGLNPEDFKKEEKPEESFAQLIKMAISSSPRQRLFLTEIYSWILENYPYFRTIDQGWRNSVRHSLSITKDFVRIKETRHRYNRGSEWCLAESNLGQWYLQLTEDEAFMNQISNPGECEFSRLVQLSTLIPELSSSVIPQSPSRPVLLDLTTCPDYLLGNVPHPELFVIRANSRKTPSPPTFSTNQIKDSGINDSIVDSFLGSPLSRKATPKTFELDLEMDLETEFLDLNELQ